MAAPEPEPAPAPEPPPPAPEPQKFVLEGVLFDHDKSTLTPAARRILDDAVRVMRNHPNVRYQISGHTDSDGSDAYNQALSLRRANAVRDYLIEQGISGYRLSTSAHGESMPVASNATKEGRAKNRRVEIESVQ